MSGRYSPYPVYRESSVKWLGEIPSFWTLCKLAHAYPDMGSGTTPPSDSEKWYGGTMPWVTTGELREREVFSTAKNVTAEALVQFSALRVFPKGSVAIAMYGATIGRLGILGVDATTNQACCVLPSSSVLDNRYLYYWFQAVRDDIINLASGGGQPNISQAVVSSLRVSCPPDCKEQTQIAKFLDYETAKIDALIDKQQQLIALLKEKRQAVISHAVTKGLDPNAPMKDSGVEWLGEVPAHWAVAPLKHLLKFGNGKDYKDLQVLEGGYPVYGSGGEFARVSDYLYDGESVLFGRKGTIDRPLYVNERFWTVDTMYFTRVAENASAKYLYYAALGIPYLMYSTNTALPSMTQEVLGSYKSTSPPLEEQIQIVKFLDNETAKIDALIEKSGEGVTLLQERRTALISAAVTGKIDVRNWQPPETEKECA